MSKRKLHPVSQVLELIDQLTDDQQAIVLDRLRSKQRSAASSGKNNLCRQCGFSATSIRHTNPADEEYHPFKGLKSSPTAQPARRQSSSKTRKVDGPEASSLAETAAATAAAGGGD